jgi:hypothetical protein
MLRAHHFTLLLLLALLVSCASTPAANSAGDKRAQQVALEKARKIIAQRGWRLPADYRVRVDKSHFIPEGSPDFYEWQVIFDEPQLRRSPASLYRVSFLCTTGEFTGAYDERNELREDEIEVARRAFKHRYPGEDYTLFVGAQGNTIEARALFGKHRSVLCVIDRATLKVKRFEDRHGQY